MPMEMAVIDDDPRRYPSWCWSSGICGDPAVGGGTLNVIYGIGALDSANIFVNDKKVRLQRPRHHGLGPDHPKRSSSPAASRCSPAELRRVIGIAGGSPRCDRCPCCRRRLQPMVVAGHLLPVRVGRLRHHRARRRRATLAAEPETTQRAGERKRHGIKPGPTTKRTDGHVRGREKERVGREEIAARLRNFADMLERHNDIESSAAACGSRCPFPTSSISSSSSRSKRQARIGESRTHPGGARPGGRHCSHAPACRRTRWRSCGGSSRCERLLHRRGSATWSEAPRSRGFVMRDLEQRIAVPAGVAPCA